MNEVLKGIVIGFVVVSIAVALFEFVFLGLLNKERESPPIADATMRQYSSGYRMLCVFLACFMLASWYSMFVLLHDEFAGNFGSVIKYGFFAASFSYVYYLVKDAFFSWVSIDETGLTKKGFLKTQYVAWTDVARVDYKQSGRYVVVRGSGSTMKLSLYLTSPMALVEKISANVDRGAISTSFQTLCDSV